MKTFLTLPNKKKPRSVYRFRPVNTKAFPTDTDPTSPLTATTTHFAPK